MDIGRFEHSKCLLHLDEVRNAQNIGESLSQSAQPPLRPLNGYL